MSVLVEMVMNLRLIIKHAKVSSISEINFELNAAIPLT